MLSGFNLQENFVGNFADGRAVAGGGGDMVGNFQRIRDYGLRRPFYDDKDRGPFVIVNTGRWTTVRGERKPIREKKLVLDLISNGLTDPFLLTANSTALRKEQWIQLDTAIHRAYRARLRAWADLSAASSYGGFNGMNRMTLEYEAMSDPGEAIVDMDGLTEERTDNPLFRLRSLPLPITHGGFWFSQRRLDISRNFGDTPLDTVMGEAVGRRIGEAVERTTIGTQAGISYGNVTVGPTAQDQTVYANGALSSEVFGYLTYPARITKTGFTMPTASDWWPGKTLNDILSCLETLRQNLQYGPFIIYNSTDWDQYLDGDYYALATSGMAAPTKTLRQRIREIDEVQDVRRLDFLAPTDYVSQIYGTNPFTMIFVSMVPEVARAVTGMDITTVQWPTSGGMRQNFKVMCINVPNLQCDYYGRTGILQATWTASS